ncbi:AAA family ATPase [Demequina sp.]|uniref:AAA family ATPase n=1 Tax=Demequina sp. TaxID=2050685 RepID=UPI003A8BA5B7
MKVLSLAMEGFGPYRERQEVDFTAFDDDIFVITGKTGAGKSTILDAIAYALYDAVPRYEGADKAVRSHFCGPDDPTSVTLTFESGGERYRVTRTPEYLRPKQRGDGLTKEKATAMLWVERAGQWEALEVALRDANARIRDIMRLTPDQFLQVILLAQGRFAEFLQADTDERLAVLRSLFGTSRFKDLEAHIREVARERSRAVETADAHLGEIVARAAAEAKVEAPRLTEREEWFAATLTGLSDVAVTAGEARVEGARLADAAAGALAKAKAVADKLARLSAARETVASLEAGAADHQAETDRLAAARRAAPVAGPARAQARAQSALADARTAREREGEMAAASAVADLAWPADLGGLGEADEGALRARQSEVAGLIGGLTSPLEAERSLPAKREAVTDAEGAVATAREALEEVEAELAAVPAERARLDGVLAQATERAARVDDAASTLARAESALEAHGRVAQIEEELRVALLAEVEASGANAAAASAHAGLVARRLASQSAHLAKDLVDGDPCPVCGSADHPSPARPTDEHVTDEEVEAAQDRLAPAKATLDEASAVVAAVKERLAAAHAQAGEGDVEQAQAAVVEARQGHELALDAVALRDQARADLAALQESEAALGEALRERRAKVDVARGALATATQAVVEAEALAAHAPEGYGSVGAYADALSEAKSLLSSLVNAAATEEDAGAAVASANLALAEALDGSGFTDADSALTAELDVDALAALETSVATYAADLAGARAVVASLGSEDLPDDPGDLEALGDRASALAHARDEAIAAETSAAGARDRFAAAQADYAQQAGASQSAREARDVALTLADSLEGRPPNERKIRLESFVLAAKLERIVAAANARLQIMSSGQYLLEHDDDKQYRNKQTGLGLRIADAHTGQSRSTRSLSGGETFLASLALALGLAETVTAEAGGIRLSTLFIDEGFGSLDGDTLEVAMATLDELRSGGRTIGLISHVEAMKEQIPAKLEVVKGPDGSSRVVAQTVL